ncbi:hypothetical protein [Halalkalibacter krulwichiae]|uniref:Uncharacterized protein n=1 Tax=Halalkalibacter krulwichiae TaxID=199441 RepID=A0A1X9MFM7_9BACI|nr:hypothetical protein [Halalkalibacter krulwichiae]ARK31444.1 hypothetical protein BkAM31D_17250 [Halalkalibacter krulwichiae]
MTQTNDKLKEALLKIEEATDLYQEIVNQLKGNEQEELLSKKTVKTLKILINEKQKVLDPSVEFEDIASIGQEHLIPQGHCVTTYYIRSPLQSHITYQSEPAPLKPWLAYQIVPK